jgi:multidrug resistance efflux pump
MNYDNAQITEKTPHSSIELHQRDVSDLLGDAPQWLIHSGSYLLYGILVLFLAGTAFISYPDVVRGPVIIDDLANAEWITANSSGQIDRFFVANDSLVKRGDTIAILQNSAQLNDIKIFLKILTNAEEYYRTNQIDLLKEYRFDLIMGDMSNAYQNFTMAVRNCLIYDNHNYAPERRTFLQKQLAILKKDPEKNELAILKLEQDIFDTSISNKIEIEKKREQLELAYEEMVNSIRIWELKYLIRSKNNGKIALGEIRTLTQMVNKGDTIASIISSNKEDFVAHIQLNQDQIAEVQIGDPVNIRLAKYPEHTYGILIGTVNSITFSPYNKGYTVDITFPDQLYTTANKVIKYELGLKGEAEIITSSRSVLSRIFNPVFSLFRKNNE